MVGFIFTLCLLCILALVGFLFAWMVRLASFPEPRATENNPVESFEGIASAEAERLP
jgi:hypothetical protein